MTEASQLPGGWPPLLRLLNAAQRRPDLEHEIAVNRLAFCMLIGIYLSFVAFDRHTELVHWTAYTIFAIAHVGAIAIRPGRSDARRLVTMIADFGALAIEMHAGGATNAAFYPIYLWVVFGNGFRFGLTYLTIGAACAIISFGIVAASTQYWSNQPLLSGSLLLALLILPAYAGVLIHKLSLANRQAQKANESKGHFLTSVSHELRTPLNAILGATALLRDTPLDDEQRELGDALEVGTRTLLSLISGVLDLSRLEAGRMPLRLEPLDLPELIAEIRELITPQARSRGLKLRFHVTSRVPETILGHRLHLHEVLLNLVGNALKFTAIGQVVVTVDAVAAVSARLRLRFEVADTGIGVQPDARERIFESFTQGETTIIDRFGGSGLGLAIAKQLVTLMGGQIGVDSIPGAGSTFWFTLDCDLPEPVAAQAGREPPSLPRIKAVLLCQDAAQQTRSLEQLAALGIVTQPVGNHQQVLACLAGDLAVRRRDRHVLILQQAGLSAELCPGGELAGFLSEIGDVPVIAIAGPSLPPATMLDLSFRRDVGTCISPDAGIEQMRLAIRIVATSAVGEPEVFDTASRTLHVLVADDNAVNRRLVDKVLERAGHSRRLVGNGSEALDALEAEQFDIVLMDVNMPVMTGIEATKLYRFMSLGEEHVPIVALTADATQETERQCLEAGMDACLTKPIEVNQLAATLERLARPRVAISKQPRAADVIDLRGVSGRPTPPVLDIQVVNELRTLGGQAFVEEVVGCFVADAAQLVENIVEAARHENLDEFRSQTHALRSCAANVGARAIEGVCQLCRDMPPADLPSRGFRLAETLRHEVVRLQHDVATRA